MSGPVTLTKNAPSVSLSKGGGARGHLRVNLNWTAKPVTAQKGGFFKRLMAAGDSGGIDLDLAALYELTDGTKGVVQALGNTFTARDRSGREIIRLDGDDRSGNVSTGENLSIDLSAVASIRRVLVFALIYEGAANWAAAAGVVTMFPIGAPPVEIQLDETRDGARICAVAMLENAGGELVVRREVTYFDGAQRALDEAYGWGMNWTRGRK
jgi:tellurite resistance protein TerA